MFIVPAMATVMFGGTVVINSAMAATCGPSTISYKGTQKPAHDEFLYRTKAEFDAAQAGYQNSNKTNSGSGRGYECDGSFCKNGSVVEMPAGHVFNGKVINHKETYQCDGHGVFDYDDAWKPLKKGVCYAGKKYGEIKVGESRKGLTKTDCSGFELTDNLGTEFELVCREGPQLVCKAQKCPEGYKLDFGPGKCILKSNKCIDPKTKQRTVASGTIINNSFPCNGASGTVNTFTHATNCGAVCQGEGTWLISIIDCEQGWKPAGAAKTFGYVRCEEDKGGNNGGGNGNGGGCKAGRSSLEGKACCDLPSSVAKWNAPNCVCVDTNKEFRIENGKGVCVDKSAPVVQDKCDCAGTAAERINMRTTCAKNPGVLSVLDTLDAECKKAEKECDGKAFAVYMNTVREQAALPNCGVAGGATVEPTANVARITSAITSIEKRVSNLDSSVWKTAEGNFNGARLASDSIAGVVLGTAGGLITSNVVKKNQIKSGFEDIVCTVGGQVVGNYGDQITVGIQ